MRVSRFGVLAGVVPFYACTTLKNALGYDDALDTFGVHAVGGTLGAFLTGLLATPDANANLLLNLKDVVGSSLWIEQLKAMGVKRLVEIIRTHPYGNHGGVPKIVIVAPPLTVATEHQDLHPMFAPRADEAKLFDFYYARIAKELGAGYFNAAGVAVATPVDGVHLDANNTRAIGEGLVPVVKSQLGL